MEIWVPMFNFEGLYEVSNLGNAKSVSKTNAVGHQLKERPLGVFDNGYGYLYINIHKNGVYKRQRIHRIIWESFNQKPLARNIDINHKDGNKHNNAISNLEPVSRSENILHSKKVLGNFHYSYKDKKLTPEKKQQIIDMRSQGLSYRKIGAALGVSHAAVMAFYKGQSFTRPSFKHWETNHQPCSH